MLAARIFGKVSPASGRGKVYGTVAVKLGGKKGSEGSRAFGGGDDTVTVTNAYRAAIPTARQAKEKPELITRLRKVWPVLVHSPKTRG